MAITHSYQSAVVPLDVNEGRGPERALSEIDCLVVHATAGGRALPTIDYMRTVGLAYHYVIDHDAHVYRMVHPRYVAYHAGASAWPVPPAGVPPHASLNRTSVGVSFANRNVEGADLTPFQRAAGLWLCTTLVRLYRIPVERVRAHREVSPGRKFDPLPSILDMDDWRRQIAGALALP